MAGVRPDHDDAFWAELASRPWHRVRWRLGAAGTAAEAPPSEALPSEGRCAAFGTPLHRAGTYYRRPVYTDGTRWLSQQGFDEMRRRTGRRASRQSRPR